MTILPRSLVFLGLAVAASSAMAQVEPPAEDIRMSVVPFTLESSAGSLRPMVDASFNGHPFRMMIHSSASQTVQLRHAQANAFGVRDMQETQKGYGISTFGKVSTLGRSTGTMDRVQVGDSINRNVQVAVFEIPQDDRGMLGIGWIRHNRVVLDYVKDQATIAPAAAYTDAMRKRLLAEGYTAVPMTFDEPDKRFLVPVTVGGTTRNMTVASASFTSLDTGMADAAGVAKGPVKGHGYGPTGTVVPNYTTAAPLTFKLGTWMAQPFQGAMIGDEYAYSATPRPTDVARLNGGMLGSNFLVASHAVVDFGNRVLYVR